MNIDLLASPGYLKFKDWCINVEIKYKCDLSIVSEDILLYLYSNGQITTHTRTDKVIQILNSVII